MSVGRRVDMNPLRGTTVTARALVLLMLIAALSPMFIIGEQNEAEKTESTSVFRDGAERLSSGRAVCPTAQNDGGTSGDAGGDINTTKTFGTDPTNQNLPGCVDASDTADYYRVVLTSGKDFTVELTVPTGADFDLYLIDANITVYEASEYNDPLESFTFIVNASRAGTYYVVVFQYSSDGGYSLDLWTNTSTPRPDLTTSSVSGPSFAMIGGTATVSYTVTNSGLGALTSSTPYDIAFILSTDTTYDTADTLLTTSVAGPNLAANTSQQMNTNVQIPSSLAAGSYYWLVWPDGYNNVTESDDLNNLGVSGSNSTFGNTGGGSLSTVLHNATRGDFYLTGLSSGTSYALEADLVQWNGSAYASVGGFWSNFTANSTSTQVPAYLTLGEEGDYCMQGTLYSGSGINLNLLDYDDDCLYYEMLEATVTSNAGGTLNAQNLTAGNSYTYSWTLYRGSIIEDSGNGGFNTSTTSWTGGITWTTPSSSAQHCLVANLYDSGSNWIGGHTDCYLPAVPTLTITNITSNNASTQNIVYLEISNLVLWEDYGMSGSLTNSTGSNFFVFTYSNFTANNTLMNIYWNFNTPSVSGLYCIRMNLYDDGTSANLDTDLSCFMIVNDDDLDGVWNENDTCPNTPSGASVDSVGCAATQRDTDGDGYNDAVDAFPLDATQWLDSDGDGFGDNASGNNADAFPNDGSQWADSDGDGYGDNSNGTMPDACPSVAGTSTLDRYGCPDADGDGWSNAGDAFPSDNTQWTDQDGDGYGDNPSGNSADAFPTDSTQWVDTDGDGYGDNPLGNNPDVFPSDGTQWRDSDADGYGDNPLGNNADAFPSDNTQWADSDGDGYGDNPLGNNPDLCPNSPAGANVDSDGCAASERDTDGDGVYDDVDLCLTIDATGWDLDQDGCIDDSDGDGVKDPDDDCRYQDATGYDADGDGCIDDSDGDGVIDSVDLCLSEDASGWDLNSDGCIDDTDGDMIKDDVDQCRTIDSTGFDTDGDGCIDDSDDDGIPDDVDECRYVDASGFDSDGNGCIDDSDGDYVLDNLDACRYENSTGFDSDGDGCIDDSDGDGVKDDVDECSEDATGFDQDGDGCIDDSDGDGIKDDVDQCLEDATGFDADGDGCIDDTDGDGVPDDVDQCAQDATGFDVDQDGCIDDSDSDTVFDDTDACRYENATGFDADRDGCLDDSDGDGVTDDADAFPNDPTETLDSDGDGVGDNTDAYPLDASRSALEEESGGLSGLIWALIIVGVLVIFGAAAMLIMRRGSNEDEEQEDWTSGALEPAADLREMAGLPEETVVEAAVDSPTTWTDDTGQAWCQYPDGSVMRFDAASGAWVPHQ